MCLAPFATVNFFSLIIKYSFTYFVITVYIYNNDYIVRRTFYFLTISSSY